MSLLGRGLNLIVNVRLAFIKYLYYLVFYPLFGEGKINDLICIINSIHVN